jgi:hypothetical protein
MTWHPPIPTAKLYSEPALALGPALAMLVWCYDGVNRDGTIEVSLERASADIGKPYRTIKEWWRQLREGPFFTAIKDKGHKGWLVQMADDWLDWHVMSNNYPQGQEVAPKGNGSKPVQGQESALEDVQSPFKDAPRTRQGQESALEENGNKVLISDQNPECVSEDRDRTERTNTQPPARTPAVLAYFETYPETTLSAAQVQEINERVTDLVRWRRVLKEWSLNGWQAKSIGKMLNRYDNDTTIADERPAQQNGQHKPARPPVDVPLTVANSNKKILPVEERRRILNEVKVNDTS